MKRIFFKKTRLFTQKTEGLYLHIDLFPILTLCVDAIVLLIILTCFDEIHVSCGSA